MTAKSKKIGGMTEEKNVQIIENQDLSHILCTRVRVRLYNALKNLPHSVWRF